MSHEHHESTWRTTVSTEPGGLNIHVTRRVLLLLTALILAPWLVVGGAFLVWKTSVSRKAAQTAALPDRVHSRVTRSKPGPWGNLTFTRIAIGPPEEFLFINEKQAPPVWVFPRQTREAVAAFFAGCELTPAQRAELAEKAKWETTAEATRVSPDPAWVLGLAPAARERIYSTLALFPENPPQNQAFSFNPSFLTERLEQSGLTDQSIDLFRRLLYRHGNVLMFADMNLVLPTLPDDRERLLFAKTVSRKVTLLASLMIAPDSDIERIAEYWGFDGRAKDLRPLLESLRRVPEGTELDVAHLLPSFARRRLYTYPVPSDDPLARLRDCHWTALNFFSNTPDDRFTDQAVAVKTIAANYYQISGGARLGDLVVLLASGERVIHSAVYVADDVVFTKNGAVSTQPWMLMRLGDLTDYYEAFQPAGQVLQVRLYRQKELAPVLQPEAK